VRLRRDSHRLPCCAEWSACCWSRGVPQQAVHSSRAAAWGRMQAAEGPRPHSQHGCAQQQRLNVQARRRLQAPDERCRRLAAQSAASRGRCRSPAARLAVSHECCCSAEARQSAPLPSPRYLRPRRLPAQCRCRRACAHRRRCWSSAPPVAKTTWRRWLGRAPQPPRDAAGPAAVRSAARPTRAAAPSLQSTPSRTPQRQQDDAQRERHPQPSGQQS